MGKTIVFPPKIEAELKKRKIKTLFVKSLRSKDCKFDDRREQRREDFENALKDQDFYEMIFNAFSWKYSEIKFGLPVGKFWVGHYEK